MIRDKIIEDSRQLNQANKYKRDFIKESIYNNDDKLYCFDCENQSSKNYIHKYSNIIKCKDCLKQIEQAI